MRIIIKPLGMVVLAVALGGSIFPLTRHQSSANRPTTSVSLVDADRWKFYTEKEATGQMEAIQESPKGVALPGFKIVTAKTGVKPWNIGVSNPLKTDFRQGEKFVLSFWARADKESTMGVVVQKNTPGFPDCFHTTTQVGPEWKQYQFKVTTFPMANYESMIGMHFGYDTTSVEVVGVELKR